jgi:hypothetical protein
MKGAPSCKSSGTTVKTENRDTAPILIPPSQYHQTFSPSGTYYLNVGRGLRSILLETLVLQDKDRRKKQEARQYKPSQYSNTPEEKRERKYPEDLIHMPVHAMVQSIISQNIPRPLLTAKYIIEILGKRYNITLPTECQRKIRDTIRLPLKPSPHTNLSAVDHEIKSNQKKLWTQFLLREMLQLQHAQKAYEESPELHDIERAERIMDEKGKSPKKRVRVYMSNEELEEFLNLRISPELVQLVMNSEIKDKIVERPVTQDPITKKDVIELSLFEKLEEEINEEVKGRFRQMYIKQFLRCAEIAFQFTESHTEGLLQRFDIKDRDYYDALAPFSPQINEYARLQGIQVIEQLNDGIFPSDPEERTRDVSEVYKHVVSVIEKHYKGEREKARNERIGSLSPAIAYPAISVPDAYKILKLQKRNKGENNTTTEESIPSILLGLLDRLLHFAKIQKREGETEKSPTKEEENLVEQFLYFLRIRRESQKMERRKLKELEEMQKSALETIEKITTKNHGQDQIAQQILLLIEEGKSPAEIERIIKDNALEESNSLKESKANSEKEEQLIKKYSPFFVYSTHLQLQLENQEAKEKPLSPAAKKLKKEIDDERRESPPPEGSDNDEPQEQILTDSDGLSKADRKRGGEIREAMERMGREIKQQKDNPDLDDDSLRDQDLSGEKHTQAERTSSLQVSKEERRALTGDSNLPEDPQQSEQEKSFQKNMRENVVPYPTVTRERQDPAPLSEEEANIRKKFSKKRDEKGDN